MSEPIEFDTEDCELGRVSVVAGRAELRFYAFPFSTAPNVKPVYVVRFEAAAFRESDVIWLIGQTLNVKIYEDRVEIVSLCTDRATVLHAAAVTVDWSVYDTQDYVERVNALESEYKWLERALIEANEKNRRNLVFVQELRRRAEIKAAATEDLKLRQAAAIAVLSQVLQHLQNNGGSDDVSTSPPKRS